MEDITPAIETGYCVFELIATRVFNENIFEIPRLLFLADLGWSGFNN